MKKTTKSAAPGKKFWICGALLGICLLCLATLSFFQSDKAREQANLLDTVNYVKIQCATYTYYNEASESMQQMPISDCFRLTLLYASISSL